MEREAARISELALRNACTVQYCANSAKYCTYMAKMVHIQRTRMYSTVLNLHIRTDDYNPAARILMFIKLS